MSERPTGLTDPDYVAFAWARYRRMLGWMVLATIVAVSIALYILDQVYGPLSWFATFAAIGGFGGTIMMAAALMGLAFLSSGTGHDEDVERIDR